MKILAAQVSMRLRGKCAMTVRSDTDTQMPQKLAGSFAVAVPRMYYSHCATKRCLQQSDTW